MKSYEEIKAELIDIADVLKKYPESIQPQVFEILTKHFVGDVSADKSEPKIKQAEIKNSDKNNEIAKPKGNGKATAKSKESVSIIKDLDLRPKGETSFKDFYTEKQPSSAMDFNTVATYYLKEICQVDSVTPNHIYTCYKEVGQKPPIAFNQSLRDTASKNGHIDTSNTNDIKIPLRGKTFVEHDLPKQKTIKGKK